MQDNLVRKANQELIELHKRVLLTYLIGQGLEYPTYKKFFILYDSAINVKNIRKYFHCPVKLFVRALLLEELHKIAWVETIGDKTKAKTKRLRKKHQIHL